MHCQAYLILKLIEQRLFLLFGGFGDERFVSILAYISRSYISLVISLNKPLIVPNQRNVVVHCVFYVP